ncbi:MAG: hypothetical protein KDH96_12115 [Candidatus Riesia sp.]|nr:hypothetical protein [Candidatus Riesia sp.]
MINLTLYITSYDLEKYTIKWDLDQNSEPLSQYELNLYRSETYASSGYEILVSGISLNDTYEYMDLSISGYHLYSPREFWYKGIIHNTTTGGERQTNEVTLDTKPDYVAKEIIRRKNIGIRNIYGGEQFVILKRKTYGTQCPICWDPILNTRTIDNCSGCYDTYYSGGYYTPIVAWGMMTASPKRSQMLLWGDFRPGDAIIYFTSFPHLYPNDVIVDQKNRRWNVVQVRTVEKGQYIIEQNCQCRLFMRDDVIYTYNISGYLN